MQNWDSELPETTQKKLNLLLEHRKSLQEKENSLNQKELLLIHKKQLKKQSSQNQQTVDVLLENEKSDLIDILDQEVLQQNSRRFSSRRMPTLEQSAISFKEQSTVFRKSNKTNRSASTNISGFNTMSPQGVSKFKPEASSSRMQFDYETTIKQLQQVIVEQQDKFSVQTQEIQVLKDKNSSLQRQLDISEKSFQKFKIQTDLFKENLVEKLSSYAKKLDKLNENEEKILQMQKENTRLKQEKEELLMLVKSAYDFKK